VRCTLLWPQMLFTDEDTYSFKFCLKKKKVTELLDLSANFQTKIEIAVV